MRRFGDVLLGLGLVVGIGAVVGYELDIIPTLPPAVLKLVIYKLAFIGGLGLLVAGALLRRLSSQRPSQSHGERMAATQEEPPALSEGQQLPLDRLPNQDVALEKLRREP